MSNQRNSTKINLQSSFTPLVLICLCASALELRTTDAEAQQLTGRVNTSLVVRLPKAPSVVRSTHSRVALGSARPQQVRSFDVTPTAIGPQSPKTEPNSPLGSALASCGKRSDRSEPFSLPGSKGEIKLDRCYGGRAQHICANNMLIAEGRSLLQDYGNIIKARYPELSDVSGVCAIDPDTLSSNAQKASEFTHRFKVLSAEYMARYNCGSLVSQSLREVALPDMAQASELIRSMVDTVEADSKDLFSVQAQAAEVAGQMNASYKAMVTIGKIQQAMCVNEQRAKAVSDANR